LRSTAALLLLHLLQMLLGFLAEDVHLVLVETFLAAKLQLLIAVCEVNVGDGVSHVLAPVAHFVVLERRPSRQREAEFAAEGLGRPCRSEVLGARLEAPGAGTIVVFVV
jgi:hypothetical protein